MDAYLCEISQAVAPSAHAILILDKAGWHTTAKLTLPANITPVPLPPRCPELNPAESIWHYMRQNWLTNLVFDSYEHILGTCCEAWNKARGVARNNDIHPNARLGAPVVINAGWYQFALTGSAGPGRPVR